RSGVAAEAQGRLVDESVIARLGAVEAHGTDEGATGSMLAIGEVVVAGEGRIGDNASRVLDLPVPVALEACLLIAVVGVGHLGTCVLAQRVGGQSEAAHEDVHAVAGGVGLSQCEVGTLFDLLGLATGLGVAGAFVRAAAAGVVSAAKDGGKNCDEDDRADDDRAPLHAPALLLLFDVDDALAGLLVGVALVRLLGCRHVDLLKGTVARLV